MDNDRYSQHISKKTDSETNEVILISVYERNSDGDYAYVDTNGNETYVVQDKQTVI